MDMLCLESILDIKRDSLSGQSDIKSGVQEMGQAGDLYMKVITI